MTRKRASMTNQPKKDTTLRDWGLLTIVLALFLAAKIWYWQEQGVHYGEWLEKSGKSMGDLIHGNGCIGLNDVEKPGISYGYSGWRIFAGFVLSETIIVPIYIALYDFKCPAE